MDINKVTIFKQFLLENGIENNFRKNYENRDKLNRKNNINYLLHVFHYKWQYIFEVAFDWKKDTPVYEGAFFWIDIHNKWKNFLIINNYNHLD